MFLRNFYLLILLLVSVPVWAETSLLVDPHWSGCNFVGNKKCYTLDAEEGATSYFSKNFFIRNIHLKIFESRSDRRPFNEISADQAFFADHGRTLYILNSSKGDYIFKVDEGVLYSTAKSRF